ncbi:hypothetical protein Lalb_Chr03g0038261 [Lupinus albus]|uniref:DUF7745 domain-containing protein n=1 Tax=Lupinus albus TaxID=3870 RepID=A0A6A4QXP6_LUPAL|nr:hypothetical protein Lalb_Chr03g0038261 [Lupinus albus]
MDSQPSASNANVKKGMKADFKIARLNNIRLMAEKIPSEVQIEFLEEYRRLYDLLFVDVNVAALNALIQFWNSDLGVFEMPRLDTVPVIEEYQQLLLCRRVHEIYIPGGDAPTNAMRKIIGLAPAYQLERKDNQGWLQSALERHLHKLVGQKEWISVKPTLALLIYGLVMFPSVPDTVGLEAMKVFYMVYKWKVDPVPTILGDTFIALSNCHKKGFHKIRCCAHLLYVWMATHVHAVKYQAFNNRVMIDFNSVELKEDSVAQWKVTLENLIPGDYRWMCYWCPQKSMISRCGSYNNVSLLVTNGCFFYTPELVLRQLGQIQIKSADEPKSIIYLYGDDNDLVKKVKEAWDKLVLREDQQRGIARVRSRPEYDGWRADRVGEVKISPPLPREECLSSREKELQSTIETLREQMNIIDGKRQDALIEVMRKDHEIEVLKKELKIEKEAYVPATLKRAKTEASVQIHKLREQLDAQREAMATETRQKTELKEQLEDFRRAVHLRDKRITELERDLRMSQQHAMKGQNQVDHLIERVSHLEKVQ